MEGEVFTQLFNKYKEPFTCFALSYIQDREAAEDIFMDAMLYYWERIDTIPQDTNIPGYILTVVKHKCLNYLRHINIKDEAEAQILDMNERIINFRISTLEACNPQELFSKEIQDIIDNTLNNLPELTSSIFAKSRYENKTNAEIAKEMAISIKTVEYHISKVIKKLRMALKDYIVIIFTAICHFFMLQ